MFIVNANHLDHSNRWSSAVNDLRFFFLVFN